MINWKNIAENLILTLISVIVGVFIGYIISINVANTIVEQQKSTIEMAIKKETTSITNQVTTEIRKLKATKSEPINIVIDPATKSVISNRDTSKIIVVQKRKGFFKRLFTKKQNFKNHKK